MKIMAVRGKNLASLDGEFAVEFAAEPLASAGLFAITGPTGAGKSTLLDALCLALFDKTPRMNRARENGVLLVDVADKTLSQNDCRSLLRRGAAEGYAEVDFCAVNGELFRARWSVRRARGRAEGSLQPSEIRLHNLSTGGEEQGGKGELLRRITQLLGLTFEQFTRAVLLAQGDFATFLKAPEEEKADLLEKLTGTEIYSQLSQALYARNKEMQERYEFLLRQMDFVPLLTDTEEAALLDELAACRQAEAEAVRRCDELKAQMRLVEERQKQVALQAEAEAERLRPRPPMNRLATVVYTWSGMTWCRRYAMPTRPFAAATRSVRPLLPAVQPLKPRSIVVRKNLTAGRLPNSMWRRNSFASKTNGRLLPTSVAGPPTLIWLLLWAERHWLPPKKPTLAPWPTCNRP